MEYVLDILKRQHINSIKKINGENCSALSKMNWKSEPTFDVEKTQCITEYVGYEKYVI